MFDRVNKLTLILDELSRAQFKVIEDEVWFFNSVNRPGEGMDILFYRRESALRWLMGI